MRGGLTAAALAPDPLQASVDARLDARLDRASTAPVALGLSGGGDSLALLHLAAAWCARARRPLLALTVEHGLSPAAAGWTARAARMAAEVGAAWRPLVWTGPKPDAGLPAAARRARQALLADAARESGASVVLLAHTADDHAETEALRRGDAPAIGRLREWAPSPAWPEGRGVFLLRPLLAAGREELRAWLRRRSLGWIDDPANADPHFARARLRLAGPPAPAAAAPAPDGFGEALPDGRVRLDRARLEVGGADAFRSLSAAVACASGAVVGPGGGALSTLVARLRASDGPARDGERARATRFTATLGGARVEAGDVDVVVGREVGRRPPDDAPLAPGRQTVWDGRFVVRTAESGWSVGAARGRMAALPADDRRALAAMPPALRAAQPVFLREGEVRLRPAGVEVGSLAAARLDAALGRIPDEAVLRRRLAPTSGPPAG